MSILGLSILDFFGSAISLFSVCCMLKKNILYWYSSIVCNILWLVVFMSKPLYISAGLQISYMLFSIYGILRWKYKRNDKQFSYFLDVAGLSMSLMIILIALFSSSFRGFYDLIEIASVVFLITANLLTAREKVVCWYFWIIGDITYAIFLFHERIYGMFIIEIIFLALSFRGLYEWKKNYQEG